MIARVYRALENKKEHVKKILGYSLETIFVWPGVLNDWFKANCKKYSNKDYHFWVDWDDGRECDVVACTFGWHDFHLELHFVNDLNELSVVINSASSCLLSDYAKVKTIEELCDFIHNKIQEALNEQ